ncbi:MAG: RloB family protein [Gammaproteobacteria bacterium]|nr:RloB family protein [Gammaproteobacteria bacterium]MDD9851279.1 RloB family protein [Gammaproteobacteria bacterium]
MASDQLFHKRKERAAKNFSRRKAMFSPYDRILIVCEGTKTEQHYFRGLANFCKLNRNNITIVGEGASPTNIVKVAEENYKASQRDGIHFNRIYCVFDKNSHTDYERALAQLANKEHFEAIVSVPCFEYWLLLHYCDSTKPYEKKGNKSACDQVISELKKHIPRYNKGDRNTFGIVRGNLPAAQANAKKSLKAAKGAGTDNPSTNVHLLVEHLKSLPKN